MVDQEIQGAKLAGSAGKQGRGRKSDDPVVTMENTVNASMLALEYI